MVLIVTCSKFYYRLGPVVPVLWTSLLETNKKRLREVKEKDAVDDTEWRGKERLSGFPFRPTRGENKESVKWHQRQREISVRTQRWTDTPDGFIHAPLGPTTAPPASVPVPTDTLHSYTQPFPLKHHLTPHITSTYMCTNTLWQAGSFFLSKQDGKQNEFHNRS